jgi:FkbM family methyltransferase
MYRINRIITYSVRYLLAVFGLVILKEGTLNSVRKHEQDRAQFDIHFFSALPLTIRSRLLDYLPQSNSQLRQDLLVIYLENFKKGGYFVEFGAGNGIDLSNTYLLETEFEWLGILAEPALCWHSQLKLNRQVHIDKKCVWSKSGDYLEFNETLIPEFSTVSSFSDSDTHGGARKNGKSYTVETISLNDLLEKYMAPRHIDYLSLDTEGSEYEILRALDFEKYSFGIITCEHNFAPQREKIRGLLESHGYTRILVEISEIDDWYVKSS